MSLNNITHRPDVVVKMKWRVVVLCLIFSSACNSNPEDEGGSFMNYEDYDFTYDYVDYITPAGAITLRRNDLLRFPWSSTPIPTTEGTTTVANVNLSPTTTAIPLSSQSTTVVEETSATTVKEALKKDTHPTVEAKKEYSPHTDLDSSVLLRKMNNQTTKKLPPSYHHLERKSELLKSLSKKYRVDHRKSRGTIHTAMNISWLMAFCCYLYNAMYM